MRSSAMLLLVSLMFTHSYAQAHLRLPGSGSGDCDSSSMASTYVPIESWIYPAIERLALAGYIQTAFAGLRPWTRMESARLIAEAQEYQTDLDSQEEVVRASQPIDKRPGAGVRGGTAPAGRGVP